jgi:predicted GNAT superfamily acetyltransferase
VGFTLKLHQRAWALAAGITEIRWTFDPLVRRNAYFNITKLGARPTEYLPEFYGQMSDGVNAGDESDRLYVTWPLAGPETSTVDSGHPPVSILDNVDGQPVATGRAAGDGPLSVATPADIEALRRARPAVARAWRLAVRDALVPAMAGGHRIVAMTPDGSYRLERP